MTADMSKKSPGATKLDIRHGSAQLDVFRMQPAAADHEERGQEAEQEARGSSLRGPLLAASQELDRPAGDEECDGEMHQYRVQSTQEFEEVVHGFCGF